MSKVIIYSTPTCIYCNIAKEFFKKNNIDFEEKDVSQDEKSREEMIEKSGQMGVPVVEINGQIIIGFDKGEISKLLNIK